MATLYWKVGELAKQTGLTVRTLHHYDEIGLLSPSQHSGSGHRLYTEQDIVRLHQVLTLRQLGFPLEEIRASLDREDWSFMPMLRLHLTRLRYQLELQQQLCQRLERIAELVESSGPLSVHETLQTIERMTMLEKYYTPEQLDELKARKEVVGEDRIQQGQEEWQVLMAEVREEMDQGSDPAGQRMQQLARRWQGLIDEFTGGNPGIEASLKNMYQQEGPAIGRQHGFDFDPKMFEFVGKALAELKQKGEG